MFFIDIYKNNILNVVKEYYEKSVNFNIDSIQNYISSSIDLVQVHNKFVHFIS